MKRSTRHNMASSALAILFTLSSQNVGKDNAVGYIHIPEKPEEVEQEVVIKETITNETGVNTDPEDNDNSIDYFQLPNSEHSLFTTSDLLSDLYNENKANKNVTALNFSIDGFPNENQQGLCSDFLHLSHESCLHGDFMDKRDLFNDIDRLSGGINFSQDCTDAQDNAHNIDIPPSLLSKKTFECIGGINIQNDDVKIKFSSTITRDTNPNTKDIKMGYCPENNLSECIGIEATIEVNFD